MYICEASNGEVNKILLRELLKLFNKLLGISCSVIFNDKLLISTIFIKCYIYEGSTLRKKI